MRSSRRRQAWCHSSKVRSSSPSSEREVDVVWMAPEVGSTVRRSWARSVEDLSLNKQPLSVRYVRGTWDDHPLSMNFLRTFSGTRKAVLVPVTPGVRNGHLREGVNGLSVVCSGIFVPNVALFAIGTGIVL